MAIEVVYSGVQDADSGEYLSGTPDPALVKLAKDGSVVRAHPGDNDTWLPLDEGVMVLPSGTRNVVVVATKSGGSS